MCKVHIKFHLSVCAAFHTAVLPFPFCLGGYHNGCKHGLFKNMIQVHQIFIKVVWLMLRIMSPFLLQPPDLLELGKLINFNLTSVLWETAIPQHVYGLTVTTALELIKKVGPIVLIFPDCIH